MKISSSLIFLLLDLGSLTKLITVQKVKKYLCRRPDNCSPLQLSAFCSCSVVGQKVLTEVLTSDNQRSFSGMLR